MTERETDRSEAVARDDWHHRCDIAACNCGRCHGCGAEMPEEFAVLRPEREEAGLRAENDRLRAAVAEGDRRIERLRESIHPTMDGYCPACGGGCLIGFATPTPARDAVTKEVPR